MSRVRKSRSSKPDDWVGKCTQCGMWRTKEHTIVNRLTSDRFCIFDGAIIQQGCSECNRTGKIEGIECVKCNGTGMLPIKQVI